MRKLRSNCVLIMGSIAVVSVSGCMSGQPVIGPFSYLSARSNEKALLTRQVARADVEPAKKDAAFRMIAAGCRENEIAIGIGVDLVTLMSGRFTAGELIQQGVSVAGDAAIYGLIYRKRSTIGDWFNGGSDKEETQPPPNQGDSSVNVQDNDGTVTLNYNYGSNNGDGK